MPSGKPSYFGRAVIGLLVPGTLFTGMAFAQEQLPWQRPAPVQANPGYSAPPAQGYGAADPYGASSRSGLGGAAASGDGYGNSYPAPAGNSYPQTYGQASPPPAYDPRPADYGSGGPPYGQQPYGQSPQLPQYGAPPTYGQQPSYGQAPAEPPYGRPYEAQPQQPPYYSQTPPPERRYGEERAPNGSYSMDEIMGAGRGFFGSVSQGLASVIEYSFQKSGRPNGYILGEDGGGAFIAGLRYGEGRLYTKDAGRHKIYWQGPSIGYDIGGEGSKVMILVYNLTTPEDVFATFSGVAGAAYLVGGVGMTFQTHNDVVLAPIRAGIGLRLGANVGYLKYTHAPTWNPF